MAHGWTGIAYALTIAVASMVGSASPAMAATDPWTSDTDNDGAVVRGMGAGDLQKLGGQTHNAVNSPPKPPWYKFESTSYCSSRPPGTADAFDPSCTAEYAVCNPTGAAGPTDGPAVRVWRMEVDRAGQPVAGAPWQLLGYTCLGGLVPGATNTLTMQMILDEFRKTTFAKPTASIQPVGLKTLVNLPTYFELKWPEQGFEPGEPDSTTLIGRQVEIEPVFVTATYIYGDGEASGPVESLGGPHPEGDVVHTYRKKMVAPVQVNATYGGRFRVDGGVWINIPDTVTIEGTPVNLTVAEAKARLYEN